MFQLPNQTAFTLDEKTIQAIEIYALTLKCMQNLKQMCNDDGIMQGDDDEKDFDFNNEWVTYAENLILHRLHTCLIEEIERGGNERGI